MGEFDFTGQVAVVTGGSGGIGRALVAALAAEGCRVAVVDLEAGPAGAVAEATAGGPHIGVAADVGDRPSVRAMMEEVETRLGPIGIYCSNAGIATGPGLGEEEAWEDAWRVHALAHVHAARLVLPGMSERGRGVFVVTASAAGLLMMMQSAAYTVTKHASVAIAEWLAVNCEGPGVQFHCVCPQGVLTPMVTDSSTGAVAQAELRASGTLIEPSVVADEVLAAIRAERFLVLPHPEVHAYEEAKVADRDRWLVGMRRLRQRFVS